MLLLAQKGFWIFRQPLTVQCGQALHIAVLVQIVELLNIVYCLAELTEFAAFIALRIKAPDLRRPYRVPLPTWGCILMLLPASILLGVILVLPIINRDWQVRSS